MVNGNWPNFVTLVRLSWPFKRGSTMTPLWIGHECLTKLTKFGPYPCTILYKLCLFYPWSQAIYFKRPPSWVAFIEGLHCILRTRPIQCSRKVFSDYQTMSDDFEQTIRHFEKSSRPGFALGSGFSKSQGLGGSDFSSVVSHKDNWANYHWFTIYDSNVQCTNGTYQLSIFHNCCAKPCLGSTDYAHLKSYAVNMLYSYLL